AKGRAVDPPLMRQGRPRWFPAGNLPEAGQPVGAPRQDGPAVRAEGTAMDPPRMHEGGQAGPPRGGGPPPVPPPAPPQDGFAIGAAGQAVQRGPVAKGLAG